MPTGADDRSGPPGAGDGVPGPRDGSAPASDRRAEGPDEAERAADKRRADRALIALVAMILFAIVGWLLVTRMRDDARIQDCVQSGRRNCAPIDDPDPR